MCAKKELIAMLMVIDQEQVCLACAEKEERAEKAKVKLEKAIRKQIAVNKAEARTNLRRRRT